MMKRPQGLGKGLGALIRPMETEEDSPLPAPTQGDGLRLILIEQIRPNPHQPRSYFDENALGELAASIKEHGVIQPLIVSAESDGTFVLIAGERRWRASKLAGLKALPVVVKNEVSAEAMLAMALIENIQRADLNALEEASAYRQLMDEFGLTQAEVAERVGKGRPTVANMVRLLDLPINIQEAVVNQQISGGHGRALLSLPTPEQQTAVLRMIIENDWSVRQTEIIVRKLLSREVPPKKIAPTRSAELADVEKQFSERLGTRVNIEQGKKGGKVIIYYYSDEELNALYGSILGDTE